MDRFVKYRACKSFPMQFAKVGEYKGRLGREMCLKNEKNEMSLCDMAIFKTVVVQK